MFIFHYYEFSSISATSKGPQWLTLMLADVRIFVAHRRSEEWIYIYIYIYIWMTEKTSKTFDRNEGDFTFAIEFEFGAIQLFVCRRW